MDKKHFLKGMGVLCATFNREPNELMVEGYFAVLSDLEAQEWDGAVKAALSGCRYMPSPAELLQFARPAKLRDPAAAIKEIRDAFGRYGRYRTPEWSDPAIAAAVEAVGGWSYLCNLEEEQFKKYTVPQLTKAIMAEPGTELVRVH